MYIMCEYNSAENFNENWIGERYQRFKETTFPVKKGNIYLPYAVGMFNRKPWYCIIDEEIEDVPVWRPGPLFKIVDHRLSRYWGFWEGQSSCARTDNFPELELSFREWGTSLDYYGNLFEREPEAVKTFNWYRQKLELEFPHPEISLSAEHARDSWVICPECNDGWEVCCADGMTKCPSCSKTMKNPLYRDIWSSGDTIPN